MIILKNFRNASDDMIAYISYSVINDYKRLYNDNLPSGLFFNKVLSILYKTLKEEKIDIKLPHCWYRWGDEVVRHYMPYEIEWNHEEAYFTTVDWNGDRPDPIENDGLRKEIDDTIDRIIKKYSSYKEEIGELLSEVYKTAPFEFQKQYKNVRDILFDKRLAQSKSTDFGKNILWPILDKALNTFPDDTYFKTVRQHIPAFKRLIYLYINQPNPNYKVINEISEEFWFWFCYYLRVNDQAHENINQDTLAYWEEVRIKEDEIYMRNFQDYAFSLYNSDNTLRDDDILKPFIDAAIQRERELESTFKEFDKVFDGLNDFLVSGMVKYKPKHFVKIKKGE